MLQNLKNSFPKLIPRFNKRRGIIFVIARSPSERSEREGDEAIP